MAGNTYIRSLDGVRAIAILLVMSFHANILEFGWIGVQLFFVLSGFLITGILWHEKDKTGSLSYKFRKFWVRRTLRIFPVYYTYLLAIAVIYLAVGFPSYFPRFFPYAISYTANFPVQLFHRTGNPLFNHLWSLSIEEQFYLLFPVIILFSSKRIVKALLIAIIILSPLVRFVMQSYYLHKGFAENVAADAVNFNTICQLDAFCTGGLIQVLGLDKRIRKPSMVLGLCALLAFGAGLMAWWMSSSPYPYWRDLGYYHYFTAFYQPVWQYTCLNLVFAALLLVLVSNWELQRYPLFRRFLENKWMVNIGKVSYGMYLFHWLIWVYVFVGFFHPQTLLIKSLLFIPYAGLVYGFSELSYRVYESRFIRLKDRFFPATPATPAPNEMSGSAKNIGAA
jgi:peptidoglycan/LPS O-acetylase OafA/YrhL